MEEVLVALGARVHDEADLLGRTEDGVQAAGAAVYRIEALRKARLKVHEALHPAADAARRVDVAGVEQRLARAGDDPEVLECVRRALARARVEAAALRIVEGPEE